MSTISNYLNKSATQNVKDAIKKAKEAKDYNTLISLTEERALERAKLVDEGKITGVLAGVPFIIKDNFLAFGSDTTAGSHILEGFVAPYQATAVEKLEAEGAIAIGKANLDSFAHGGSTENSAFGVTKNAYDKSRVAGGSSGGSAASVALGIVPFALGSDTGGSIRQPASFNGVVGVKPTYGMVSRYGVVGMASSTDTIGVFTTNSADAELIMDVISGQDQSDMTTLPNYFKPISGEVKKPLKIGVVKEFMDESVNAEVREKVNAYIEKLRSEGNEISEVSLPTVKYAVAIYYIVVSAELSSNMARYDGIRYGKRSKNAKNLSEIYEKTRGENLEKENKRRIIMGSFVLSSGFFDAYYLKAQKARTILINEFNEAFKNHDILIGPVSPTPACKIGERINDPIQMYLADIMTAPASLAGMPSISVPAGNTEAGLPVGVQLIGPRQSDALLLAVAKKVEEK